MTVEFICLILWPQYKATSANNQLSYTCSFQRGAVSIINAPFLKHISYLREDFSFLYLLSLLVYNKMTARVSWYVTELTDL